MKRKISLILALMLLVAFVAIACDTGTPDPTPTPSPTPTATPDKPDDPPPPPSGGADVFVWNNYADRTPGDPPEFATNGMNIWWNNWANLRASNTGDAVEIFFRPAAFDPEDFDDYDDYFARAGDWMGNFGEAVNMWAIEGISFCKYLTIRMAGAVGGEENFLILHFQPEDGPSFVARFADLVTKDGGNAAVTTDMQDIVIDLEASGFPGMTNRMHIRSFAECTIILEEISFSDPVAGLDPDNPVGSISIPEIGSPADLPIRSWAIFPWDNFDGRVVGEKPEYAPNGMNLWWDNFANLSAEVTDGVLKIDYKPVAFDPNDDEAVWLNEDQYFEMASDWMGNWGEAINMWAMDGIAFTKYVTFRMAGGAGGEEDKIMLHFQPSDGPSYVARFSDLVTKGGGSPKITTDMQDIVIDLAASGFAGMTNRMHVRAFVECTILIDEIYFSMPVATILDVTDDDTVRSSIAAIIPGIGNPADLDIRGFIAEAS